MACKEDTTLEALRNMMQCSICIDTFKDPRVLPCAHTFCLKCLEKTQHKTKAQCALCRKQFDISEGGGLSELPKNAMIQELIDLSMEPKSSNNSEAVQKKKMVLEENVISDAPSENIASASAKLPPQTLHCGNCNNCELCSRVQDAHNNEEVHENVALADQTKVRPTENTEIPKSDDTKILCDVCLLNNSDGKQKVSKAALYCLDCKENQCDKCSAEHMRQRLCKHHTVVSLEDHLKEELLQKEKQNDPLDTTIFCDVCLDNNDRGTAAIATLHCIDCTENQCDDCSREHKRQRLCKYHQVVVLDDLMKNKVIKVKDMSRTNNEDLFCDVCAENSENDGKVKVVATWRCADCDENQCDECNREHKRQRLSKEHQIVVLDDQLKDTLIKRREMARSTNKDVFCDVCAENNENGEAKIAATWQCIDCNETQCDDCNREHKRQRLSKSHHCVVLDDQMKETLVKARQKAKSTEVYVLCDTCQENNEIGKENNAATLYCTECKENQCEDCSKEHKRQRLSKNHQIIPLEPHMKEQLAYMKMMAKTPDIEIMCDVCAQNSELGETWSAATLYCIECDENQCKRCSGEHKKQNLFGNHEIIPIDDHTKRNMSKMEAEADILCDRCVRIKTADIIKATFYCIDCKEKQCEECNRSHIGQEQLKHHRTVALNVQMQQKEKHPRTCSVHIKDKLKLYCFTCQKVICMKCIDPEHESHEFRFACMVAEDFLTEVDGYLEKVDSWLQQGEVTKYELQIRGMETENAHTASRKNVHNYIPENVCSPKEHQLNPRMELKKELDEHQVKLLAYKRRCSGLRTHKSSVSTCLVMNEIRIKFEKLQRQQELYSPERLLPSVASSLAGCKSSDPTSPYYDFRHRMKELVQNELAYMLKDEAYSKIQKMIEKPNVEEDEVNQFWHLAFFYIMQRIKMWNGYVLTAQNVADLVIRKQKLTSLATDSNSSASGSETFHKNKLCETSIYPVSRLDFLTYLINIADCIVAHDILRIMSKFPMAIPLIVQDIHEDDKYIVTVPIIQNTLIKWESNPGQIAENHLFTSQFRMVAAIRLGTNKIGKSTILNQLMSNQFMFSSKGEAGSRYGRPSTLDGAVEIVWLTQETCSSPTWKTTIYEYYKGNSEEVAILANLHGNALQHPETLKYLAKYICSFLVFLMPGYSKKEWDQLKQIIKNKDTIKILADPQENANENYTNAVRTESLSSDDTLYTVRCLLKESFAFNTKEPVAGMHEIYHAHELLRYTEPLHCKTSEDIVAIVRYHGCFNIKQLLRIADIKVHAQWDFTLKHLIKLSLDIFSHSPQDAKKYLTHLETALSQLSANESMIARAEVSEANELLRRIIKVPKLTTNGGNSEDRQVEADLEKVKQKLKLALDKVDNANLGQEHFFRALGQMYENSLEVEDLGDFTAISDLPNHFANLLIKGNAIEMLNGDSSEIQIIWIKAICDSVMKMLPNLKVFVISIIGLQSSGKSTLLNALFSCRFAVSVGRCSRGLFMRMIFLDKMLRNSHGCDAIILIDTEGLSSPEKMNDPKANQKDRLMATLAMGISNLTLVNILGEGMTEMTEILQIAIVAMARLKEGGIKPDILMVQHLQERNISKIDQAKGQFCDAINKAFELISMNDVEIGSASAECLAELTTRIHSGDLFQHFGPFKDGSSVNSPPSESYHNDVVGLLETILKRTEVSENKTSFERWCSHFESYWTCVQEENFALNFKNVKHITDFLYFEKKIAKVKELLDRTIRCHRESCSKAIREQVSSQVAEKRNTRTDSKQRQMLLEDIEQQMQLIPHLCPHNCEGCKQFNDSHAALLDELSNTEWKEDTKSSLETYNTRLHAISIKTLGQTFDGSVVRQGCFSDFSGIIASELKEALLKRPSGIYSTEEQRDITKSIWEYLQNIAAGREGGPNLEAKLNQTLHREYCGIFPAVLKDFEIEITFDHLANSKAIKSLWGMVRQGNFEVFHHLDYKLSEDQLKNLMSTINQLIDTVFGTRCAEFCKTGLDFEEGMVGDIKTAFPNAIKTFEHMFRLTLHDKFKQSVQMYALQHFRRKMMHLQNLWDSQNKPSEILIQKKQDYITEIETRLKSGFSSAGEGEVVAAKLCNAVKKKAIQAGYEEKIRLIKNMPWTTNSEKVRLRYFEELSKEVQAGEKLRALTHFNNPKDEIQKWYKQRIDAFEAKARVIKMYKSTLKTDLNHLLLQISNYSSEAEINKLVEEHIKAGDDQYYSKLHPKDCDFDAFKNSIVRKLKSFCELADSDNIVFPLASDDSDIMSRLGCTEHCFWCGALCWGSRDHQLEKDNLPEMEAHHSCHQPCGLKCVTNRETKKLDSSSCHNTSENTRVWFGEYQGDEGMHWSAAKRYHFKDWKFDAHCITKFDELMRWFFQELHQDIAKSKQVVQADEEDLKAYRCQNLKLCDILKVVRSKI